MIDIMISESLILMLPNIVSIGIVGLFFSSAIRVRGGYSPIIALVMGYTLAIFLLLVLYVILSLFTGDPFAIQMINITSDLK